MLAVLLTYAVIVALAALVASNAGPRRALGLALGGLAPIPAWFLPADQPTLRAVLALAGILCFLRVLDLARDRRAWSPARRLWHVVAMFDTRRIARARPRLAIASLAAAAAYAGLATAGFAGVLLAAQLAAPWALPARWLAGAVACYAMPDAVAALVTGLYAAIGVTVPPLHRAPILSRSAGEFWSERWNLTVHAWLRAHCFLPAARRFGVVAGGVAAFVGSALIHVGFTWPAAGALLAASMGAFFLVQGAIVVLEPRLAVRAWSSPIAHAWTVLAVLGPSPLLVEPMLRMLGL